MSMKRCFFVPLALLFSGALSSLGCARTGKKSVPPGAGSPLPSAPGQLQPASAPNVGPLGSKDGHAPAKNVILFVGDGMGVSTITAARVYAVGVDGQLTIDTMPYTAVSRTYTADHLTPDSAGTISAMMTGVNANSGVLGFGPATERGDFNQNGDGPALWTLGELAKASGRKVGIVTTARVTHATPAGAYAHVNERNDELKIALQALPGQPLFNQRLGEGLDLLMGGGRRFFVPSGVTDEEGEPGIRPDGLDLRRAFQKAGYTYVYRRQEFDALTPNDQKVLALFDSSHMEWEHDRSSDLAGEPSLAQMTNKAIELLSAGNDKGYFLLVEGGRIDHAHHAGNAFRALTDTKALDQAVREAMARVNLKDTMIIVTADHSHVFTMAGYPVRPPQELAYPVKGSPEGFGPSPNNIFNIVYQLLPTGEIAAATDFNQVPYTILGYQNGPGYRGTASRVDPSKDKALGLGGKEVTGPTQPDYLQESTVPLGAETHGGEDVIIYAAGAHASSVHGTLKNTAVFDLAAKAMGLTQLQVDGQ